MYAYILEFVLCISCDKCGFIIRRSCKPQSNGFSYPKYEAMWHTAVTCDLDTYISCNLTQSLRKKDVLLVDPTMPNAWRFRTILHCLPDAHDIMAKRTIVTALSRCLRPDNGSVAQGVFSPPHLVSFCRYHTRTYLPVSCLGCSQIVPNCNSAHEIRLGRVSLILEIEIQAESEQSLQEVDRSGSMATVVEVTLTSTRPVITALFLTRFVLTLPRWGLQSPLDFCGGSAGERGDFVSENNTKTFLACG